jgi:hypothetical protein
MKWYAAHIVLYVQFKSGQQKDFPVWENIVLLHARSEADAWRKAEQRGREDAGDDDGSFRWAGQPATWVFAGVRKLTLCDDPTSRPGDGSEITYSEMRFKSRDGVADFVAGRPVNVRFAENFEEETEIQKLKQTAPKRKLA